MPHSFNKIWIHAIWSTKNWYPFIASEIEYMVYEHMYTQFNDLSCPVRIINGMPDHIHCLYLLKPQLANIEVIKQVKGNTSFYINDQKLVKDKFAWQTGYAAFSISESAVNSIYKYIKTQKEHHKKKTSMDEYNHYLELLKS
jgi:REP element-mobilizing transposase RayT